MHVQDPDVIEWFQILEEASEEKLQKVTLRLNG